MTIYAIVFCLLLFFLVEGAIVLVGFVAFYTKIIVPAYGCFFFSDMRNMTIDAGKILARFNIAIALHHPFVM
jgi:hypothetical protein